MKSSRMLPKKYHAIAFLSILVMLLLLGLHLLGFGFLSGNGGGGSINAAAALARNSTGGSSSPTGASSTLNPNAVYRHPIVYDKLTGATNNQIQDVLGGGGSGLKQDQFPLDHYQRQQQHQLNQNPFDQFAGGDPFASHLGQNGRPFRHPLEPPPPPPLPHPLGAPLTRHHNHLSPPLPPPPMPMPPVHIMTTTTQSPQQQQQQQQAPAEPRSQQQDSLPSASSLNNNVGGTRPQNSSQPLAMTQPPPQLAHYYQQQQHQQQQPVYYTPPIFTYSSNFDAPQQGASQSPPLGVPEVPLSVDEFNVRQNRLRQLGAPKATTTTNSGQDDQQPVNLLADPQAQQRHKQQMLDRQLLFGPPAPSNHNHRFSLQPTSNSDNFTTSAAYYPDPALFQRSQLQQPQPASGGSIRPPYAAQPPGSFGATPVATQLESPSQLATTSQKQLVQSQTRPPPPMQQLNQRPLPTATNQQPLVRSGQQAPLQQVGSSGPAVGRSGHEPACARQMQSVPVSVELANSSSQLPVLFCNQDSDYPTNEVMQALEMYASERSIEQLIPQQLVQMLIQTRASPAELQRQLTLDSLQANVISPTRTSSQDQTQQQQVFPSSNYESLCSATTWIAQPRRAKTLGGQWKVVVNLPGHKYRGIAISQMVRLEECQRPNGECSLGAGGSGGGAQSTGGQPLGLPRPRSRCLQTYGNQRLLAWSHQQGLHFDLFRVPVACSCHIRRS